MLYFSSVPKKQVMYLNLSLHWRLTDVQTEKFILAFIILSYIVTFFLVRRSEGYHLYFVTKVIASKSMARL